jgi:hypothetical protein
VWGEEPTLCRAPGATLGRSTIYLIIIILFISLLRTLLLSPFVLSGIRHKTYPSFPHGVSPLRKQRFFGDAEGQSGGALTYFAYATCVCHGACRLTPL